MQWSQEQGFQLHEAFLYFVSVPPLLSLSFSDDVHFLAYKERMTHWRSNSKEKKSESEDFLNAKTVFDSFFKLIVKITA